MLIAAAIQRTKRIKLGPLVYVLPMYHPIRLYEEICMLDHMSNGRLLLGVGRGATLFEHERFGVDAAQSPAMYHEAYAVLMRAFETDVLNFEGKFYNYKDYLLQTKPVQRPHPPIWYGAPFPDAVGWAAPEFRQRGLARLQRPGAPDQRPLPQGMGCARPHASRSADDRHDAPCRGGGDRRSRAEDRAAGLSALARCDGIPLAALERSVSDRLHLSEGL